MPIVEQSPAPVAKPLWRRGLRWCGIILLSVVCVSLVLLWLVRDNLDEVRRDFRKECVLWSIDHYSIHLGPVDRVDILRLDDDAKKAEQTYTVPLDEPRVLAVVGKETLAGADAESLADLWRHQELNIGGGAACHIPHHVLCFHLKTGAQIDIVICFSCGNYALPVFPGHELVSPSSAWVFSALQEKVEGLVGKAPGMKTGTKPSSPHAADPSAFSPRSSCD